MAAPALAGKNRIEWVSCTGTPRKALRGTGDPSEKNARHLPQRRVKRMTMRNSSLSRLLTSLLITLCFATGITARAQDDRPKTPLAQQMGGIAKDFRALRKIVNDPTQKDAAVALVKDMEDHATKAKTFDPEKAKDIAPADKAQFITDYRTAIDGLLADFQKLEQAISDGRTAEASALLDKLQQDKRDGHKKFNAH